MMAGGSLAFATRMLAIPEPRGEERAKGRKRMPAARGDWAFTAWDLWGISITATVKGTPERTVML